MHGCPYLLTAIALVYTFGLAWILGYGFRLAVERKEPNLLIGSVAVAVAWPPVIIFTALRRLWLAPLDLRLSLVVAGSWVFAVAHDPSLLYAHAATGFVSIIVIVLLRCLRRRPLPPVEDPPKDGM
ncbi:MAG: hypothetical protein EON58_02235 [Alphaproteobacteria bacterium]|nr:MAG: hypothetical protein EON58_02235 [Alphaproteobacteria bacterium]